MTYETLATIASLFEEEKNRRERELALLREKLNAERDKLELAPEDDELLRKVEFSERMYNKARKVLLKVDRACEEFLEHDFR